MAVKTESKADLKKKKKKAMEARASKLLKDMPEEVVVKKKNKYNKNTHGLVPCDKCDNLCVVPLKSYKNGSCTRCGGDYKLIIDIKK